MSFRFQDYPLGHNSVPDDPSIDTYGQDAGECEVCGSHLDSGHCPGHCENETCDHVSHCDVCERGLNYDPESGCCFVCEAEYLAARQLTYPMQVDTGLLAVLADLDKRFRRGVPIEEPDL